MYKIIIAYCACVRERKRFDSARILCRHHKSLNHLAIRPCPTTATLCSLSGERANTAKSKRQQQQKRTHTHTSTQRQGMKADRQRTDGPGKSKLSCLLPRLLATAAVVVVARGLVHVWERHEYCVNCKSWPGECVKCQHDDTTIAPTMTRMNDNFT